jgi:hypothetical protein
MSIFRVAVLLFAAAGCCLAADETNLTLIGDGVTYSNVTFGLVTVTAASNSHSSEIVTLPLSNQPTQFQEQLGNDPDKADTLAMQQAEAAAAYLKQQEEKEKRDMVLREVPKVVPLDALPFSGGEIPLAAIKADPQKYIEKPVTIVGCVEMSNLYLYGYEDAVNEYYSLRFVEFDKTATSTRESLRLYLSKEEGQPLMDILVKRSGKCVAIRMQVRINGRSFVHGIYEEMAEVVNWASLSADRQSWDEWELASPVVNSR